MDKKIIGIVIVIITIITAIAVTKTPRMKKVKYEYEPISIGDIDQVRRCVKEVTGFETLDIEELLKDQILFSDIYRYCLKTVEDPEAVLEKLAK